MAVSRRRIVAVAASFGAAVLVVVVAFAVFGGSSDDVSTNPRATAEPSWVPNTETLYPGAGETDPPVTATPTTDPTGTAEAELRACEARARTSPLTVAFEPTKTMTVGRFDSVEVIAAQGSKIPSGVTLPGNPAMETATFDQAHCEITAKLYGSDFTIKDDGTNTQSFIDGTAPFRFRWKVRPDNVAATELRVELTAKGLSGVVGQPWSATVTIAVRAAAESSWLARNIGKVLTALGLAIIAALGTAIVARVVGTVDRPGLFSAYWNKLAGKRGQAPANAAHPAEPATPSTSAPAAPYPTAPSPPGTPSDAPASPDPAETASQALAPPDANESPAVPPAPDAHPPDGEADH